MDSPIRLAIAGVGNCASSLIQGIAYYRDAEPDDVVPGLMHVELGGYHVRDLLPVVAFDVDQAKVGTDLGKAIHAGHNNTVRFAEVGEVGVTVLRGPTMDGLGRYYKEMVEESPAEPVDVAEAVHRRSPQHGHAHLAHLGKTHRVVVPGVDRLAEVRPHLGLVDVEGDDRHQVPHVVAPEFHVHQPRYHVVGHGVAVIRDALDEGAGAVADTGDREADGAVHGDVSLGFGAAQSKSGRRRFGRGQGRPLGLDERVEPADVPRHAVGGVLHDGAGVDVEVVTGCLRLAEALDEERPPSFQQRQPRLGRQMPGERQPQPEAPCVVGRAPARQQFGEEQPAGVGDPVHLLGPPRPAGGVLAGPQHGELARERTRGWRRRRRC